MPLTLPARKCALFLSAFAIATAVPALSASTLLAQSGGELVEQPQQRNTQSDLPQIPEVAGDHRPPVTETETPEVAGEQPRTVPPASRAPEAVGPVAVGPVAVGPVAEAAPSGDTLPVTGLDVMLLLGAAAAAGGVGFALRRGAAR